MRKMLPALALCLGLATASASAEARTVRDHPYPLDTTWNAVIRLVRVDFGFTIDERDRDLGYFTFQYREGRRTVPGSVEVLRADVDGRPGTRVILQVPQMPTYVESMMLVRLERKLRSEFGEPPAPPPRRPAEPARPPAGEQRPPETPAQPAQPSQPAPTPAPTAQGGRWEPPPRIRLIEDFDD